MVTATVAPAPASEIPLAIERVQTKKKSTEIEIDSKASVMKRERDK